jgi:hypothetical protein
MIGDSALDILNWYDILLQQNVVPMGPYNHQNTAEPLDIEHRVEDRAMAKAHIF